MSLFGTSSDNEDTPTFSGMQTSPYMGINPNYLDTMDQYILPEDAGPVRSRAQMMFSTIGSATVVGAGFGGLQTFRYSGLGWLRAKSARMQFTSGLLKNGGRMAQRFGSIGVLYCTCSIICEKSRGVEDELNTLVGGAVAGGLFVLPSIINPKSDVKNIEGKLSFLRRIPPVGRIFVGSAVGLAMGGLLCLYSRKAPDYISEYTKT